MDIIKCRLKLTNHIRNFRQIISEHAVLMTKLIKSKNDPKEMLNTWSEINYLTDEWAFHIAYNNNDIGKETRSVIMMYSDVLCDVIIGGFNPEIQSKIQKIIKLESKFLSIICKKSTQAEWCRYTQAILYLIKFPNDSQAACECFKAAEVLGNKLDLHHSNHFIGP